MADERKNIDQITRTVTTLAGTERFVGRDGSGDFKATIQAILDLVSVESIPVGTVTAVDASFPNTPPLGAEWHECNGSVIPVGGVYAGYRSRNLNGGNVVLSLTWVADGGGAYTTVSATDITALNVGDWVSGAGISLVNGQPPLIIDITGTTVTINNTTVSGVIATTFNNDGVYIGGGVSGSSYDTMQTHRHSFPYTAGTSGTPGLIDSAAASSSGFLNVGAPVTEGTSGNVRTGRRTRPHTRFLKYYMRIL